MNIRMLHMFVEVARQGGFSRAARTVHVSQPTVSKGVQSVEEALGVRLVERLFPGIRLTAEGEIVYARAVRILAEFEALEAEVAALQGLETGVLRMGLPPVGSGKLFAESLSTFRQRYPKISIQLQEEGCAALEEQVLSGTLELAVTLLPVPETFCWLEIRDEPLMALMPPHYPLEGRTRLKLEELAGCPFIWFERGFLLNERIGNLCRRRGLVLQECLRSGQVDFIITLVAAGLGVAVLPRLELEGRALPDIQTALLDEEELRWRAAMIWRRTAVLSPAAQAWIRLLPGGEEKLRKTTGT